MRTVSLALVVAAGLMAAAFPDPPNVSTAAPAGKKSVAVLAGGCFWGMQGVFEHVKGVTDTEVGYSGGAKETAHYERIERGDTNHAESIQITFDPSKISYGQILRIFFSVAHDPTQLNRQGPDSGTQYRSGIFYANADQQRVAQAYIAQLDAAKIFGKRIVTKMEPLTKFYPAEDYHQDYLILHPHQPYIVYNDLPKIEALKRVIPEWWQDQPVTVAMMTKAR